MCFNPAFEVRKSAYDVCSGHIYSRKIGDLLETLPVPQEFKGLR